MSIGNTKTNGNKGNNFAYQLGVLELLKSISDNTATGPGTDYELITTTYKANKNGIGYFTGNTITRTQIIQVPAGTIISTIWFNQSTGLSITAPPITDIDPIIPPTAVTVSNLPLILGQALMANSLAVTIASDQSSIPVLSTPSTVIRTPSLLFVPANTPFTNTIAGRQEVSIRVSGNNGQIGGVAVPNGYIVTFRADKGDTVNSVSYQTGAGTTMIITYLT